VSYPNTSEKNYDQSKIDALFDVKIRMLFKHCRTVGEIQALRAIRAVRIMELIHISIDKQLMLKEYANRIEKIVSSPLDADRAQMALSAEISALVAKNRCSLNPTVEFVQKLFDTHLSVNERIINYFRVENIQLSSAPESVKSVASLKPISNYLETKEAKKATEIIEYFHSNEHSLNSIEHKSGPKTFNHKGGSSNPLSVRDSSNPGDPTFQTTL
jgi:hypothetical protein